MNEYWHKLFECPFYESNRRTSVKCEAGNIAFQTKEATTDFMERACITKYRDCPIYISRQIDYEEMENEKNKNNQWTKR